MVEALADRASRVRVGPGTDAGVHLGPIQNQPQFDRVSGLVAAALARGGTAVAGGHPMNREGYFFAPTILTGVAEGTPIVDEEQFGPAVPVIGYRDLDDAVTRGQRHPLRPVWLGLERRPRPGRRRRGAAGMRYRVRERPPHPAAAPAVRREEVERHGG